MGYIVPPPPADDEIIFTKDGVDWTWGQHRAMEKSLASMEADDQIIKAARTRLDQTLIEHGVYTDPTSVVVRNCEYCGTPEFVRHDEDCRDYYRDLPVTREAGGYRYLDSSFQEITCTSVPMTDEEALEYFGIIQVQFPGDVDVRFIMRRPMHEGEYELMPYYYDKDKGEVYPIERPGE